MADLQRTISAADVGVLVVVLLISLAIGVYYACTGSKQRSTGEFFIGNRRLIWLPTALSLLVTFESSIFILGVPAEGYVYGVQMWVGHLGFCVASLFNAVIVPPLFYPLPITSVYEYLELRYKSRTVRLLGTALGILRQLVYMGIVLFGPALAFHAVSGFPVPATIFIAGIGATIYTAIGGLKAVVWTDMFQFLIIFTGIFALLIQGTIIAGGPAYVWNIAQEGGRLHFFDFRPDPTIRHTFWSLLLGFGVIGLNRGFNQASVQRVLSQPSLQQATRLWLLAAPAFLITMNLALYMGIVTYAYYFTIRCDPIASGAIRNLNQVMVVMAVEVFDQLPGMAGIFLAAVVSASLSTLSSSLSGLSVSVWEDILKPHFGHLPDSTATVLAKLAVAVLGVLACAVAVAISYVGGTLIQITLSIMTAFAAPITGLFLLSCFFPWANKWGALSGSSVGLLVSCFLSFGSSFVPLVKTPGLPPAPIDRCLTSMGNITVFPDTALHNVTDLVNVTMTPVGGAYASPVLEGFFKIFKMSYLLYGPVSLICVLVVGNVVSIATGGNRDDPVDPAYLIPVVQCLCPCLQKTRRQSLRRHMETTDFEKEIPYVQNGCQSVEMTSRATSDGRQEITDSDPARNPLLYNNEVKA